MQQTAEQYAVELGVLANALPTKVKSMFLRTAANYQLRSVRQNLRNEREPDGTPWPALSPLTLARRGHSRRALYGTFDPTKKVRSVAVDDDTVAVGTNDPILGIHHGGARMTVTKKQSVWMYHNLFGGEGPPGPFGMFGKVLVIPRRRAIGFSEADKAEHERIAARYVDRAFEKH